MQSLFVILAYLVKYLPYLPYLLLRHHIFWNDRCLLQTSSIHPPIPHVNAAPWFQAGQALQDWLVSVAPFSWWQQRQRLVGCSPLFRPDTVAFDNDFGDQCDPRKRMAYVSDSTDPKPTLTRQIHPFLPLAHFSTIACCLGFTLFFSQVCSSLQFPAQQLALSSPHLCHL